MIPVWRPSRKPWLWLRVPDGEMVGVQRFTGVSCHFATVHRREVAEWMIALYRE
jgi:hypothetical protein